MRYTDNRCINWINKLDIGQTIDVMAHTVVANDSGLMVIGVALHKTVVALYGLTIPVVCHHYRKSRCAYVIIPCRLCRSRICPAGHLRCLQNITVDMVFNKIQGHITNQNIKKENAINNLTIYRLHSPLQTTHQ